MRTAWPTVPAGELLSGPLRNGISPSATGTVEAEVLTLSAVTGDAFDERARKTAKFASPHPTEKTVRSRDLLICRGNGNIRLVGRARRPPLDLPDVAFPDTVIGATFDTTQVDLRYVEYVWDSQLVRSQIEEMARSTNGTHKVNQSMIEAVKVPLPPIEEQRRIAVVLERADELRAKRREALAKLDTITQAIFVHVFGDPATNTRAWAEVPVAELADGHDGIKCGPFGTQLSADEYANGGVPLWGIPHVNRHFRVPTDEFLTPEKAQALSSYDIRPGDIVMTRKGTVGNCAVYPDDLPAGVMHSDLLRLRLGDDADPNFLAAQLTYSRSVQHQVRSMSGGAVMAGINVTKLRELVVVAPPVEMQREFAQHVGAAKQQRARLETGSARLDDLFASLQQRAFRGEL